LAARDDPFVLGAGGQRDGYIALPALVHPCHAASLVVVGRVLLPGRAMQPWQPTVTLGGVTTMLLRVVEPAPRQVEAAGNLGGGWWV
jgi:hypothetical protein